MIDNTKEYIICAAIWYKDGTEAPRGMIAQNIDSGVVIGQWRHGNCINVRATNPIWNKKTLKERVDRESQDIPMMVSNEKPDIEYDYVDGFLTSKGRFVDMWLEVHKECTNFVILDDRMDFTEEQQPHFVHVNPMIGLTDDDTDIAIITLNHH